MTIGLGKIVEGPWDAGLENSLTDENLVGSSVGAWKLRMWWAMQKMEAWLLKFQREV